MLSVSFIPPLVNGVSAVGEGKNGVSLVDFPCRFRNRRERSNKDRKRVERPVRFVSPEVTSPWRRGEWAGSQNMMKLTKPYLQRHGYAMI